MTDHGQAPETTDTSAAAAGGYTVVARRYRPRTFDELIGQEHVARALRQAISTDRVGHAYLFTGARGVGKTSAARVLAKSLNCEHGPTADPCNECDACESIARGDDVDVLEIDGASNRGIDEIRQLRQNVAVRPSRARLKIYIIDEVHMLTKEAFNALLKTLEEPPEHVKFIFATTEPNKIPITILSRCQRFDFAGIDAQSIQTRLMQIAQAEGVGIEPEAVQILAARAAGSMRDSQSLLEQLLAISDQAISADDVNSLLGIAPAEQLGALVQHLVDRNAAAALADLDAGLSGGVDTGQLLDQLIGYYRDVLAACVGCGQEQLLYALPTQVEDIAAVGQKLGVETVLAVLQVLDHTAARLRVSVHGRTLLEMAIVRICSLGDLDDLARLVSDLQQGTISPGPANRPPVSRGGPATHTERPSGNVSERTEAQQPSRSSAATGNATPAESSTSLIVGELSPAEAGNLWEKITSEVGGLVSSFAQVTDEVTATPQGELVIRFAAGGAMAHEKCQRTELQNQLQQVAESLCGRGVVLRFERPHVDADSSSALPTAPRKSTRQQSAEVAERPFVKKALTLFDVEPGDFRYAPGEDGD